METEFAKLPAEAQGRIVVRNDCVDALVIPSIDIEKASLLVQMIREDYMDFIDDENSLIRWRLDKPRIRILVDMIDDYIIGVRDALQALNTQLIEGNEADRGGGSVENG